MSARDDLAIIYACDPEAVVVVCGTRRTRGFLCVRRTSAQTEGFGVATVGTTLRVVAGTLGAPAVDTRLSVGGGAYRLLGLEPADGDGSEEIVTMTRA